jgi:hypothetical protein
MAQKINVKNIPFNAITSETAPVICHQIRIQINLEEFLSNQNELCKLYFELLERICEIRAEPSASDDQRSILERHSKKKLYSLIFCEIISHSIVENPAIYRKHTSALKMFFADFLYEINLFSFGTFDSFITIHVECFQLCWVSFLMSFLLSFDCYRYKRKASN